MVCADVLRRVREAHRRARLAEDPGQVSRFRTRSLCRRSCGGVCGRASDPLGVGVAAVSCLHSADACVARVVGGGGMRARGRERARMEACALPRLRRARASLASRRVVSLVLCGCAWGSVFRRAHSPLRCAGRWGGLRSAFLPSPLSCRVFLLLSPGLGVLACAFWPNRRPCLVRSVKGPMGAFYNHSGKSDPMAGGHP